METTKEKCISFLTNNGLWPQESEQVFEAAKPRLEVGGYQMTWDRPANEYPNALYAVMFITLKAVALEWIDQNKPMHFARPMFTSDPEAEIARLQVERA